jgi:hypothetical protein
MTFWKSEPKMAGLIADQSNRHAFSSRFRIPRVQSGIRMGLGEQRPVDVLEALEVVVQVA